MRSVLNISVPNSVKVKVDNEIKKGRYATVSEFFRALLGLWEEQELAQELVESRKQIANGKGKILRSLKSLR